MKAILFTAFGGPEQLVLSDVPQPVPQEHEVLIQVRAAGVNPVDWKIREGLLQSRLPHELPIIPGWDVAGVVADVGKNVTEFKIGDEVFAYVRKPVVKWGAYAEFVAFDAKNVALKPRTITMAQAAALPLVSLTAWQSIFDTVQLTKGETILIHAGSGGVGSMAIQFAKHQGATVFTTASAQKHAYVKQLGAEGALDYKGDFATALKAYVPDGVDVVFDCVGGKTLEQSLPCLKKGGRLVSLLEQLSSEQAKTWGVSAHYVFVVPNGEELKQIADLIDLHHVVPPPVLEMPLSQAAEAQEKLRAGDVFGKIVLILN
jgi:NADPH2:quinone reductase